jgi:trk system potassium uptake protein TrkA
MAWYIAADRRSCRPQTCSPRGEEPTRSAPKLHTVATACSRSRVHVVVVGCGRVGSQLAIALEDGGHSVAVIDKNRNAFRWLPEGFGGRAIHGFGFDRQHLEQAGIRDANGDNTNILSARIARETYEVPNVVARIYDPKRAAIYQRLGIPTVAAVSWTTDQVLRRIFPERSISEWSDASSNVMLLERALPDLWAGRKLGELDEGDRFRLVALSRRGEGRLTMPGLVGQEGDILHLMVRRDAVDELENRLHNPTEGSRR